MARTNIFSNAMRQPGTYNVGPFNIPDGVLGLKLWVDRTGLEAIDPSILVFSAIVELSFDGGTNWVEAARIDTYEGAEEHPDTTPITECTSLVTVPAGSGRKIRGTLTVFEKAKFPMDYDTWQ